jgi:hypothetical protein
MYWNINVSFAYHCSAGIAVLVQRVNILLKGKGKGKVHP